MPAMIRNLGVIFVLILLFRPGDLRAEITYIYDESGRLTGVIDPSGESAVYSYDAVGNLLSITRQSAAQLSIIEFTPNGGPVGTKVTIYGTGFSPTATDNTITFNGVAAPVLSASATEIVATVPPQATSGPIAVATPTGNAASRAPFSVIFPIGITLTPWRATVAAGTSRQFTAAVTGTTDQSVLWRLEGNGMVIGTLSETGLYSVPSTFTETAQVVIKAISLADTTKVATAIVSVLPPGALGPHVSPQVSVTFAAPPPPPQAGLFVAPQLSVTISPSSASSVSSGPFVAPQVSIKIDPSPVSSVSSGPFVTPQVSVGINPPSASSVSSGPFVAPQVSASLIPIISAIRPNSGAQGATELFVTIKGTGLSGASSLTFLFNGVVDPAITSNSVTANADGTQATAILTIAGNASAGLRVVRITASNGASPAATMEGNVFTVTGP